MKNEDVTKWANRYGLDKFPSELRAMINDAHELVQQEDDLYTTPPAAQPAPVQHDECVVCGDKVRVIPRPWVGLTDAEMDDIYYCVEGGASALETWREQARAIEAKLKEKNHV
jgi:hypothetical protein